MSYLPELRGSLVQAAERVAETPPVAQRRGRPVRRLRALPGAGLRALPVALGVALVVAIAVVAVAVVRHRTTSRTPAPTATQVRGRQGLIDILAVLRRPQTAADLDSQALKMFIAPVRGQAGFGGTPDRSLIRRAATTPWGSPVFLVPETARATGVHRPGWTSYAPLRGAAVKTETLALADGSGGTCCASASAIRASGVEVLEEAARPTAHTRIVLVVPDGVVKVAFILPRQPNPTDPTSPVYPHPLTVSAPVHNNVVAVQLPRQCCTVQIPSIWYGAGGRVVKRLGNTGAAAGFVAPPQPAPETPRSRAAERDPSTPNPVWVRPAAGGPQTSFLLHFRALLNQADYSFHSTGPHCPSITFSGGAGGGPGDLRGRIFTSGFAGGTWCPGTYRVSVTAMDRGRAGNLTHPAKPFGTATFTVHP